MPIRINPKIDLKPCKINLNGLKGIAERVHNDFPNATFSATDYIWEILDEPKDSFLAEVANRQTLDSFTIKAQSNVQSSQSDKKELEIVFNNLEATFNCIVHPSQKDWVEHFLFDINKHLLPPSLMQRVVHTYFSRTAKMPFGSTISSFTAISIDLVWGKFLSPSQQPYCKIVLEEVPTNSFVENIKANLVSNLIWLLLGALALFVTQLVFQYLKIDINPFD